MFSSQEFQTWAKDNVVLFSSIMTRIPDRKEDDLLSKYGFRGFPSLAILKTDGDAITKKVDRSLGGMKTTVQAAAAYSALQAKVDAGEDYDKTGWFMAQLGLGQLDLKEAKKQFEALGLTGKTAAKADEKILGMEIDHAMATLRKTRDEDAVAQKVFALYKADRKPAKDHPMHAFYIDFVLKGADLMDDADAYKWAAPAVLESRKERLDQVKGRMGDPRFKENQRALDYFKDTIEKTEKEIAEISAKLKELG